MAFQLQSIMTPDEFVAKQAAGTLTMPTPSKSVGRGFVLKSVMTPDEFLAKQKDQGTIPIVNISNPSANNAAGMGDLRATEAAGPTSTISQWKPTFWQKLGQWGNAFKAGFTQEGNRIFGIGSAAQEPEAYLGAPEAISQSTYQPTTTGEKVAQFVGTNVADLPFFAAADLAAGPVGSLIGRPAVGVAEKLLPRLARTVLKAGTAGGLFGAGTEALHTSNAADIAKEAVLQAGGWIAMGLAGEGLARLGGAVLKGLRSVPEGATTREINAVVDEAAPSTSAPEINTQPEAPGEAQTLPLVVSIEKGSTVTIENGSTPLVWDVPPTPPRGSGRKNYAQMCLGTTSPI